MFRNYLTIAIRTLIRHRLYSFINIAGLAVGLTCAIFILLFVRDQLSYDRWIPGTDNLYRLEQTIALPGKPPRHSAMTSFIASQAMAEQIPGVQAHTRLKRLYTTLLVGSRQFSERVNFVDPNFLQIIRLPLAAGDPALAFASPASLVLSETAARKYFGDESPLGKTVIMSGTVCVDNRNCALKQHTLTVTGVLRDLPHNTQFQIEVMVPDTALPPDPGSANWLWLDGWSYVRLAPNADPDAVIVKFRAIIDRSIDMMQRLNVKVRASDVIAPSLVPFAQVHFATNRFYDMAPPESWTVIYGFSTIGVLILLIACFNFTNLATARAMMRAREISLRKVVGAKRVQLLAQFLSEAVMMAMIALVVALAFIEMLLPLFDRILGLPIEINYLKDWPLLLGIIGVAAMAGLLSGVYPALVLSGFRPATVLRAAHGGQAGSSAMRTLLVMLQFSVSIGLGIAVAVIFAQISFTRNIDLGFRKDAIAILKIGDIPPATADAMAQDLRRGAAIAAVAASDDIPFTGGHNHAVVRAPGAISGEEVVQVFASPDYMALYGIKLLVGRLLSDARPSDGLTLDQARAGQPYNILINAGEARRLAWSPQEAVGKVLTLNNPAHSKLTIVGVVADIKQDGPKSAAEGIMYIYRRQLPVDTLSVRIRDGQMRDGLAFIARTWHAYAPGAALQWHFLDDDYDKQFQSDERQETLFGIFVGLAIFIACLGLFGLAAFTTERRTREIGLRKAFGAETGDIVRLLLWQFSLPVLIANALAWPVTWYYLHDWLQGFAYRISLSPLYFLGAGATALVIAWSTVFVHARRVADANPIHALRYE